MPQDLQRIILEMVRNAPQPIKTIADQVGKPYSTLMRELDPEDRGAKLGVDMLLPLMQACDSVAPLRYMAGMMSHRVSSTMEIIPDKQTFHEELLDTYEALVEYHRVMLRGESIDVVAEHRELLIRSLKEDFVAYMDRRGQAQERAGGAAPGLRDDNG